MKLFIACFVGVLLGGMISGCHHADEGDVATCIFAADTIASDSASLNLLADSLRTYSYQYAESNRDSILKSLCTKGLDVKAAYHDAEYFCKDIKGPRFVVVLKNPDTKILNQNFLLGNEGRFGCASRVVHYMPVTPINESH